MSEWYVYLLCQIRFLSQYHQAGSQLIVFVLKGLGFSLLHKHNHETGRVGNEGMFPGNELCSEITQMSFLSSYPNPP